jgi:hypothetical protein
MIVNLLNDEDFFKVADRISGSVMVYNMWLPVIDGVAVFRLIGPEHPSNQDFYKKLEERT